MELLENIDNHQKNIQHLQDSKQDIETQYNEYKYQSNQSISNLESRIQILINEMNLLKREKDNFTSDNHHLHIEMINQDDEIHSLRKEMNNLHNEVNKLTKVNIHMKEKHLQELSSIDLTTQQYHQQVQKSQEVLQIMKQQKQELLIQNERLQHEVDKYVNVIRKHGLIV